MQHQRHADQRLDLLCKWLEHDLGWRDFGLAPASADASFRRYFRVTRAGETFVVMDAPPEQEDVVPYLRVAEMLAQIGVHAPAVLGRNEAQGFVLLTDLGSTTYLSALADRARAELLYRDALSALTRIQAHGARHVARLPPYDERLLRFEMSLFTDWLLRRHLQLQLSPTEARDLSSVFDELVRSALAQPQVFVHRDYHSRNLMVCEDRNPGILDFQDAMCGPLTYDLVSLLRDCYVEWPAEQVREWALEQRDMAAASGVAVGADAAQFLSWFDCMGVQRHLKASGIFARLWHRDGKPGYLPDVPRTLGYVVQACAGHPELDSLGTLVAERVLPAVLAESAAAPA
ncbi:MAG TPA: phosphotransferase [Steroidobacteraceae bacterium]|nr:phosphotransferase [Steroidobacteraceae bacterium]